MKQFLFGCLPFIVIWIAVSVPLELYTGWNHYLCGIIAFAVAFLVDTLFVHLANQYLNKKRARQAKRFFEHMENRTQSGFVIDKQYTFPTVNLWNFDPIPLHLQLTHDEVMAYGKFLYTENKSLTICDERLKSMLTNILYFEYGEFRYPGFQQALEDGTIDEKVKMEIITSFDNGYKSFNYDGHFIKDCTEYYLSHK